jgi:hypothetical protein
MDEPTNEMKSKSTDPKKHEQNGDDKKHTYASHLA